MKGKKKVDCVTAADLAEDQFLDEELQEEDESAAVAPEEEAQEVLPRHPSGTWKVWEGTWFYMTKTPGFIDVKCWLKSSMRNDGEGLGKVSMSRTLTPYHYLDDWEDPWKTMLLLRSWSVWRARWQGWARAKSYRLREVDRQVARLTLDIRRSHEEHGLPTVRPLFGSEPAHALLVKWTPDVCTAVLV